MLQEIWDPSEDDSAQDSDELHDGSESESQSDADGGGLLDVEASDESEDDYDESAEDEFWNGKEDNEESDDDVSNEAGSKRSFPLFRNLPPELRQYIWELAASQIKQPRILRFKFLCDEWINKMTQARFLICPAEDLRMQTRHARRLLAVNREARSMVMKSFPDSLESHFLIKRSYLSNTLASIRFHADRDVITLNGLEELDLDNYRLNDFARNVKQLGIHSDDVSLDHFDERFPYFLDQFPNLKRLFVLTPFELFDDHPELYSWCGSNYVHVCDVDASERLSGIRQRIRSIYCWPNLDDYREFAQTEVTSLSTLFTQIELPEELEERRIEHSPMMIFDGNIGAAEYSSLVRKWKRSVGGGGEADYLSSCSDCEHYSGFEDEDEDEDQYEDDFIDDTVFPEDMLSEDTYFDAVDEEAPCGNETFSNFGSFDEAGRFPSVEPDIGGAQDDSDQRTEQEELDQPVRTSRKRQIVTDSDDEAEILENGRGKRARTRSAVWSDYDHDEDDDDVGGAVNSDDANGAAPKVSVRQAALEGIDSTTDDDDEDDDDEEDEGPKRLSLAQKLQIVRRIVLSESEGDEGENDGLDDSEDDGEEEEEEDDVDIDGDDLIAGIAGDVEDDEDY